MLKRFLRIAMISFGEHGPYSDANVYMAAVMKKLASAKKDLIDSGQPAAVKRCRFFFLPVCLLLSVMIKFCRIQSRCL